MTIDELNDLVIKESTKLTEDNWIAGILPIVENILRDYNMIPDEMALRWADNQYTRYRNNVMLYLPETKDDIALFNVPIYKVAPDAQFKPRYEVQIHFSLLSIYAEHKNLLTTIDKVVIELYKDKTDREVKEYEESGNTL